MKIAVPSRTREEAEAAVCTGADLKKSQKRTALLQPRISPGSLFHSLQAQQALRSIVGSTKPIAHLSTNRKLLGRIGSIVLAIAAIVGIATISNTPEVSVVTAVPTQTEITEAAKSEVGVASKAISDPKLPTVPLVGEFGFSLDPAEQSPTRPSIKAKEPLAVAKPESMPSPAKPVVAEASLPSPESTTSRKFFEIAVELKIEDGRVSEAHVANRKPGAEAFEATALHIARQRRYPPGTSRTETLVVRVANQFGRKP